MKAPTALRKGKKSSVEHFLSSRSLIPYPLNFLLRFAEGLMPVPIVLLTLFAEGCC